MARRCPFSARRHSAARRASCLRRLGATDILSLLIVALLICLHGVAAAPSSCLATLRSLGLVKDRKPAHPKQGGCSSDQLLRPCGALPSPSRRITEQVSRQCAAVLDYSRVAPEALQRASELAYKDTAFHGWCDKPKAGNVVVPTPPYPVVIDQGDSGATFAFCTVPKAGCTRLRSLLHLLTHKPPNAAKMTFHRFDPHFVAYPNLWHYEPERDAADGELELPKIVVGRNPYTRALSGFLDKLTLKDRKEDQDWINYKRMYKLLQRPENQPYKKDREGFRAFARALSASKERGVSMNEHFRTATKVCNVGSDDERAHVAYNYAFKLEQMSHWLPCLSDALGLNHIIWKGWSRTEDHITFSEHDEEGCWFRPGKYSCQEYEQLVRGSMTEMALPGPFEDDLKTQNDADQHATQAWGKLQKYYDSETEKLIYEYYQEDFEFFGYARMDMDSVVSNVSL